MIRRLSLHARLILLAAATGLAILVFASIAIGGVLERFVMVGVDKTLDTQIGVLERALEPDGSVAPARIVSLPKFDTRDSGWGWAVRGTARQWSSGSALQSFRTRRTMRHSGTGIVGGRGRTNDGRAVHVRFVEVATSGGPVTIIAFAPRELIDAPLDAARGTLLASLGLIAFALVMSTAAQLRYGLQPLRRLSNAVARIRSGEADRLPANQPRELLPLVEEVNGLIDQNRTSLEQARRHVANLAHGLKTPLATLSLRLARENASVETRKLVEALDQRIAHHLQRARIGAHAASGRARTEIDGVIDDLLGTIQQIHRASGIRFSRVGVPIGAPSYAVAVEQRDFDELLGNLIDNAGRHARSEVRVAVEQVGPRILIAIEDDGPGMAEADIARVVEAGVRLDESLPGFGFGLAITTELVQLYGGTLVIARSATLGGACVTISLPRAG
ncbi:HAMP domain-containing sensor histidine kinase [Sphingomonas sp. BGYR3]|uniref:sensor histidine kinase n=1 Tax=Sphingomonas sp. BGYR3 TaxID=2975483 RepID=UPI0021A43149|nr:HAMP domain-containing sensor histidine kinase [Sphingomonas sp. BGYR3]MDG5487751.1 HAMP domain-containing sensor histidine kinase [Sphingomonas sp. BGYR3]